MVEPFFRKPRTPQEWRLRAQATQARLEGLSIDELMRGGRAGVPPHPGVGDIHGRGYDPDQPRVPPGHPDGGQWTNKGGQQAGSRSHPDQPVEAIVSDLGGDVDAGARYAAKRVSPRPIVINGRSVQPTVNQASRLAEAEFNAQDAIARVREVDPNWRPRPSAYATVEALSPHVGGTLNRRGSAFKTFNPTESCLARIFAKESRHAGLTGISGQGNAIG